MRTASLALAAAFLLGACAQAPLLAPQGDQTGTSGSTILRVEEVANIRNFPEPRVEMDGSSASPRQGPEWRWARSQMSETQARLGVDPLWKRCRSGAPEEYGFVHSRSLAWNSDEDDVRVRFEGSGGERVRRSWHTPDDDTLDFRVTVERQILDAAQARSIHGQLKALGISGLPAAIEQAGCLHAPVYVFESCVEGRYRMTYDACPYMRPDKPQNPFHRAIALLRDGAP